jgi:hypothetical protein
VLDWIDRVDSCLTGIQISPEEYALMTHDQTKTTIHDKILDNSATTQRSAAPQPVAQALTLISSGP